MVVHLMPDSFVTYRTECPDRYRSTTELVTRLVTLSAVDVCRREVY